MPRHPLTSRILHGIFNKFYSVSENKSRDLGKPKKIIIIRQHNQLGDLLAGVSLFRALKESYPDSHITLVVSEFNYPGMVKNRYIDRIYVFKQNKLIRPSYLIKTWKLLKEEYDLAIVPVVVSVSFTSNLLARISNSKIRIGPNSLDGKLNESAFFFDRRVDIDWRKHPDSNVSERSLDIVRPFGITTINYRSDVSFDSSDSDKVRNFISRNLLDDKTYLIGFHVGAGKQNNRWSLIKYSALIKKINENFSANFYLTGSLADREEINFVKENLDIKINLFIDHSIPEVAALVSESDLFISNDTGIMHVAGSTDTPQISIFGPTNPFNWAPIGANKYFIRKSELIDDIAVDDVYHLCDIILSKNEVREK